MKLSHTPGPWFVSEPVLSDGAYDRALYIDSVAEPGRLMIFAECFGRADWTHKFDSLANARLISAAPELLAALQWIVDHGDTGEGGRPAYHAMRNHARAAIAKATGDGAP